MKITLSKYNEFTQDFFACRFRCQRYGQAFINHFALTKDDFPDITAYRGFWNNPEIGTLRHYIEHHFLE